MTKLIPDVCTKCGTPFQVKHSTYHARKRYNRPHYCPECMKEHKADSMRKVMLSMTPEQQAARQEKLKEGQKRRWNSLSVEQKEASIKGMLQWQRDNHPGISRSRGSITLVCPECQAEFQIYYSTYKRREKEGRAQLCVPCTMKLARMKQSETAKNRSPERRAELRAKFSAAHHKFWDDLSPEERERRGKYHGDKVSKAWWNKSEEEREAIRKKNSESHRK